ncbi:hypothetical protein CENSYa_2063 [Cenarchaeum symbiosum A]|uniref:Uncharacterized protein n=1 Tax=Cenarchaeum symbiosum (strain A) TaxID=414004 RepID=A0RZ99_CENSY|nr:hypothetical protein CENSYa_2063 [Cenarchaeum symbiosum A]
MGYQIYELTEEEFQHISDPEHSTKLNDNISRTHEELVSRLKKYESNMYKMDFKLFVQNIVLTDLDESLRKFDSNVSLSHILSELEGEVDRWVMEYEKEFANVERSDIDPGKEVINIPHKKIAAIEEFLSKFGNSEEELMRWILTGGTPDIFMMTTILQVRKKIDEGKIELEKNRLEHSNKSISFIADMLRMLEEIKSELKPIYDNMDRITASMTLIRMLAEEALKEKYDLITHYEELTRHEEQSPVHRRNQINDILHKIKRSIEDKSYSLINISLLDDDFYFNYIREVMLSCVRHDRDQCTDIFVKKFLDEDVQILQRRRDHRGIRGIAWFQVWLDMMKTGILHKRDHMIESSMRYLDKRFHYWEETNSEWNMSFYHDLIASLAHESMDKRIGTNEKYLLYYMQFFSKYMFPEERRQSDVKNRTETIVINRLLPHRATMGHYTPSDTWSVIMRRAFAEKNTVVFEHGLKAIKVRLQRIENKMDYTSLIEILTNIMKHVMAVSPRMMTVTNEDCEEYSDKWTTGYISQFLEFFTDDAYVWLFADTRITSLWLSGMERMVQYRENRIVIHCLSNIRERLNQLQIDGTGYDEVLHWPKTSSYTMARLDEVITQLETLTHTGNFDKFVWEGVMPFLNSLSKEFLVSILRFWIREHYRKPNARFPMEEKDISQNWKEGMFELARRSRYNMEIERTGDALYNFSDGKIRNMLQVIRESSSYLLPNHSSEETEQALIRMENLIDTLALN